MKFIVTVTCCLTLLFSGYTQEFNADSVLRLSQTLVEKNEMNQAIEVLKQSLTVVPNNLEIQIQLGRVYSWTNDYPNAEKQLKPLMTQSPINTDAVEALLNVYLWSGSYEELLVLADFSRNKIDSNNVEYALRSIQARIELNKLDEAEKLINTTLKKHPRNNDLLALRTLLLQKKKHAIIVSYMNTSFNNPGAPPQHIAEVAYKHVIDKTTLIGRVSGGHLFNQNSFQGEIDYYHPIKKRSYIFLTTGVGDTKTIFPRFRFGGEIFYTSKSGRWESSIGTKYLNYAAAHVFLHTASISYYKFRWAPTIRGYLADVNGSFFPAVQFSLSRYNEINERRIQFDVSYGTTPYNTSFTADVFTRTSAWRAGGQYEFRLGHSLLIRSIFMYELEEFVPTVTRNRFMFQCILTKRF